MPVRAPKKGFSTFRIPLLILYLEGFSKDSRKIDTFSEPSLLQNLTKFNPKSNR